MELPTLSGTNGTTTKLLGVIRYWNDTRGFGFIRQNRDGVLYSFFLHASKIASGAPKVGAVCLFREGANEKGPIALDVEIVGGAL